MINPIHKVCTHHGSLIHDQKLKAFKGRRVVVTGEELIDPRWPKTPVLAVETIELTP